MKATLSTFLAAALLLAPAAFGQLKVKSEKERDALLAVQNATDPDVRVKAIDDMLTNFADTEFKPMLLTVAMQTEQQKGDYAQTIFYADQLLQIDPKNVFAEAMLAQEIPRHSRENDLDKQEKLAKAEKYANALIKDAPDAPKPNPTLPDDQWAATKKDMVAQAHDSLGQIAMLRDKYDVAIGEFKTAAESATDQTQQATSTVRLAQAYAKAKKYDDAIATYDKAAEMPGATAPVKQFIVAGKAVAVKEKGAAAPATAPAAAPKQP